MIDHQTLMALKVGMLEDLVIQLYAAGFLATDNPRAEAEAFAKKYREIHEERKGTDPEADLVIAEVWGELMDRIVAEVVRRLQPPAI